MISLCEIGTRAKSSWLFRLLTVIRRYTSMRKICVNCSSFSKVLLDLHFVVWRQVLLPDVWITYQIQRRLSNLINLLKLTTHLLSSGKNIAKSSRLLWYYFATLCSFYELFYMFSELERLTFKPNIQLNSLPVRRKKIDIIQIIRCTTYIFSVLNGKLNLVLVGVFKKSVIFCQAVNLWMNSVPSCADIN